MKFRFLAVSECLNCYFAVLSSLCQIGVDVELGILFEKLSEGIKIIETRLEIPTAHMMHAS